MLSAILLAGGVGRRFGGPKQFKLLNGKPLALHSFEVLGSLPFIDEIIVVAAPPYRHLFEGARFANPGERRQDSVFNGLNPEANWTLIHDSARPYVTKDDIIKLYTRALEIGAACLATPVTSTIKETRDGVIQKTLPRDDLYEIQTPQMIRTDWLIEGFAHARKNKLTVTDDVALIEPLGYPAAIAVGHPSNTKITTPHDLPV